MDEVIGSKRHLDYEDLGRLQYLSQVWGWGGSFWADVGDTLSPANPLEQGLSNLPARENPLRNERICPHPGCPRPMTSDCWGWDPGSGLAKVSQVIPICSQGGNQLRTGPGSAGPELPTGGCRGAGPAAPSPPLKTEHSRRPGFSGCWEPLFRGRPAAGPLWFYTHPFWASVSFHHMRD